MIEEKIVNTTEELISKVREDYKNWDTKTYPWFRGEPNKPKTALLPKLFRKEHNENMLLQHFRMEAPSLGIENIPPTQGHTDQWLFLAQHVGLPTRLLDWTEGLFIALYFALKKKNPVIWMLDPIELNRKASRKDDFEDNDFGITWLDRKRLPLRREDLIDLGKMIVNNLEENKNIINAAKATEKLKEYLKKSEENFEKDPAYKNIRDAWVENEDGLELPFAIHPTNIHSRMSAQKSCFTVHGTRKEGIANLVGDRVLKKYVIPEEKREEFKFDIQMMGISETTVFPDLDGLATELKSKF